MRLVPYNEFEIKTELGSDEVMQRIMAVSQKGKFFQRKDANHLFFGEVEFCSFRLMKRISYTNSFNPVIKGTVTNDASGTLIHVKQSLHVSAKIFMIVWLVFELFALFVILINLFAGAGNGKSVLLHPFIMLFGGMAVMRVGFWMEARKTKEVLEGLLK